MQASPALPVPDAAAALDHYGDMLYRICFVMLRNTADAEDAVQETFLQYLRKAPRFADAGHERAWLITTAKNKCRDILRERRRHLPLPDGDALPDIPDWSDPADSGILEALLTLPEKYRLVLTLYYVEDVPIREIARTIQRTPSAVKMRLQKGRRLLDEAYRREFL